MLRRASQCSVQKFERVKHQHQYQYTLVVYWMKWTNERVIEKEARKKNDPEFFFLLITFSIRNRFNYYLTHNFDFFNDWLMTSCDVQQLSHSIANRCFGHCVTSKKILKWTIEWFMTTTSTTKYRWQMCSTEITGQKLMQI